MKTTTTAEGTHVTTDECMTPVTGVCATLRRAAVGLACAALVASSASACKPVASDTSAEVQASLTASASPAAQASAKPSSDPACTRALDAVSTYGPTAAPDATEGREFLDNAEIGLIVLMLDQAANSAGNSAVKQSIIHLLTAYLKLRDSLSDLIDSAVENGILADISNLKSQCGS